MDTDLLYKNWGKKKTNKNTHTHTHTHKKWIAIRLSWDGLTDMQFFQLHRN